MSDDQLSGLLDRAVHHAPQMHLSGEDMLAAGKGRVRRRRAVGAGGVLGAAAIVAAVWGGLAGGAGDLLGTTQIQPATTVWEQGEAVDGTLFAGLQTIDGDQVAHSYDARLSRPSGDGPVTLALSDEGSVVEEVVAQSPVPGLEVFAGERMTVAVWAVPEGAESFVPLVGPRDPGGPSDVRLAQVGGVRVAFSVWAGDVVQMPESVRDVYLVGRADVATLTGAEVETHLLRAGDQRAVAFHDVNRGVWGYAVDSQGAMIEQLGDRPAHASASYAVNENDVETLLTVLPEGAADIGIVTSDGTDGDVDTVELGSRTVLLSVARADVPPGGDPTQPIFTLGGEEYDLGTYLEDLGTLHLADGSAFSVDLGAARDGEVSLRRQTNGEQVALNGGAGLAAGSVDDSLVAAASGWDAGPTVLADSRAELSDGVSTRWVTPTDVAQVALDDGTLVTVLAVPGVGGSVVTGIGRQVGDDVERWEPGTGIGDRR